MQRKNGPWTIEDSTNKYSGKHIQVVEDRVVRPDGKRGEYATASLLPGVAVLPIDEQDRAYLTRQFRYAIGRESVEVVSGGLSEGEAPLEAARREAREELGIEADAWTDLGFVDIDTSVVRGPVHLFFASGLRFSKPKRGGTEQMQTVRMPLRGAVEMVMDSRITHAASCALILKVGMRSPDGGQSAAANASV